VIDTVKKVTGTNFSVHETERRAGDPPVLIADSSKLKKQLLWKSNHDSLDYIIKTAWEWEKKQR
jgi:UDP-glucose 4-epimerase